MNLLRSKYAKNVHVTFYALYFFFILKFSSDSDPIDFFLNRIYSSQFSLLKKKHFILKLLFALKNANYLVDGNG